MLASPIISVIYEHGRFNAEMTRQTAGALQFYAIGLVSYSALKVLTPAFYAIGKRNTPMVVRFCDPGQIFSSIGFSLFRLGWGHRGLAFFDQHCRDDQFPSSLSVNVATHATLGDATDDLSIGQDLPGRSAARSHLLGSKPSLSRFVARASVLAEILRFIWNHLYRHGSFLRRSLLVRP